MKRDAGLSDDIITSLFDDIEKVEPGEPLRFQTKGKGIISNELTPEAQAFVDNMNAQTKDAIDSYCAGENQEKRALQGKPAILNIPVNNKK